MFRFLIPIVTLFPHFCFTESIVTPGYKPSTKIHVSTPDHLSLPEYLPLSAAPGSTPQMSWKIAKFPNALYYDKDSNREKVIEAATWAFDLWSSVANLDFYQTYSNHPDIELRFEFPVEHDKNCPNGAFEDLSTKAVAHYVVGSKNPAILHFNDEFHWSARDLELRQFSTRVKPLKIIIAHEIGHALGLAHTNVTNSIMNESHNLTSSSSLSKADMQAIMLRYGVRIAPKRMVSTPLGNCPATVTSVVKNANGQSYSVCAILYDKTGCDGDSFALGVGYLNLTEYRKNNGRKWADTVSSMEINPECSIDLCMFGNLDQCRHYRGGLSGKNIGKIDFAYDNNILSVYCACGIESEFPSHNITTTTSHFTSKLAATTDFGCPRDIVKQRKYYDTDEIFNLCAITYNQSYCGGERFFFPVGQWELSKLKWNNTISSLQINPGCSMKICTHPGLTGNCGILRANNNTMSTIEAIASPYDNNVESVLCQC